MHKARWTSSSRLSTRSWKPWRTRWCPTTTSSPLLVRAAWSRSAAAATARSRSRGSIFMEFLTMILWFFCLQWTIPVTLVEKMNAQRRLRSRKRGCWTRGPPLWGPPWQSCPIFGATSVSSLALAHCCAIFLCCLGVVKYSTGWGPPVGGCKSFWKVLQTEMTN